MSPLIRTVENNYLLYSFPYGLYRVHDKNPFVTLMIVKQKSLDYQLYKNCKLHCG